MLFVISVRCAQGHHVYSLAPRRTMVSVGSMMSPAEQVLVRLHLAISAARTVSSMRVRLALCRHAISPSTVSTW